MLNFLDSSQVIDFRFKIQDSGMKVFTIILQKVNDVYTWKELIMIACKKSECTIHKWV